jgi:hypothetical protein
MTYAVEEGLLTWRVLKLNLERLVRVVFRVDVDLDRLAVDVEAGWLRASAGLEVGCLHVRSMPFYVPVWKMFLDTHP